MNANTGAISRAVLAMGLGAFLPIHAVQATLDNADRTPAESNVTAESRSERAAGGSGLQHPLRLELPDDGTGARHPPSRFSVPASESMGWPSNTVPTRSYRQYAQFSVPSRPGTPQTRDEVVKPLPADLTFQYAYGSDSESSYRRDVDLNRNNRDNVHVVAPTAFGVVTYRPNNWLESQLELTLDRPLRVHEERTVTLANGEVIVADKKRWSLLIDQAFLRFKGVTDPFEITIGRRNFEDPRLWLYDAALDAVVVKHRVGYFHTEASVSRENITDLDLFLKVKRGRINDYMWYTDYRGIEDHRLAAYVISRHDSARREGQPLFYGLRSMGRPIDEFNYWADMGFVDGKDQLYKRFVDRRSPR